MIVLMKPMQLMGQEYLILNLCLIKIKDKYKQIKDKYKQIKLRKLIRLVWDNKLTPHYSMEKKQNKYKPTSLYLPILKPLSKHRIKWTITKVNKIYSTRYQYMSPHNCPPKTIKTNHSKTSRPHHNNLHKVKIPSQTKTLTATRTSATISPL